MFVSEQTVFQRFFDAFAASRSLHPRELRAAQCIAGCGTRAMGAHVLRCPDGACELLQFHACRHRSCPRCAQSSRSRWIEAEFQRLLPCPHWHIVVTLPHELIPLWALNRSRFTSLFMRCVRESLLELMRHPRYRGAPPGIIPGLLLSLHTWGRTLSHHPHVHCLLSAGGINDTGRWRDLPSHWVLPVRVLQALLRGKLLGAVSQAVAQAVGHGRWLLPPALTPELWRQLLRSLWRKHWNVEIRGPYDHGRGVVLYLARYAKGAPVPPHRFLELLDQPATPELRMPYLDHRSGQQRTLHLSVNEFISRVLWHAPRSRHPHHSPCRSLHRRSPPPSSGRTAAAARPLRIPPMAQALHFVAHTACAVSALPATHAPRSRTACCEHADRTHFAPSWGVLPPAPLQRLASANARPNPSFKLTRHGKPPGPRDAHVHHASRGPGGLPRRAA